MQTLAIFLLSLLLAAATAEEIGQAVQDTYDGGGYQTEHPLPRPLNLDGIPHIPDAVIVIMKGLLWTGVLVVVILLGVAVFRHVRGRDADPARSRKTLGERAAPPQLDAPLGDATALAEQGRYDEAVHVLLLRTIQALAEHQRIPASLTSREILRKLRLDEQPSQALERLVDVVELSLFGGRAANRDDYVSSVEAFEALRASLGRSAS